MTDVLIARRGAVVHIGGVRHRVYRGRTFAEPGAAVVEARPDLWAPLSVDFPADGDVGADPAAGSVVPDRPSDRARREEWDGYAVALGADPAAVAELGHKADVIALADQLAAGV